MFCACDGNGASLLPQGAADEAEGGWCQLDYLERRATHPVSRSALAEEAGRHALFVGQRLEQ